jgi:hypothetical protein
MRPLKKKIAAYLMLVTIVLGGSIAAKANSILAIEQSQDYTSFRGMIVGYDNTPLVFVTLFVTGTNISTISNTEGNYLLKVPNEHLSSTLELSLLGYQTKIISLSDLKKENAKITMEVEVSVLDEVSITRFSDAYALVKEVFKKRAVNTLNQTAKMTAFYRETIKKRNRNVSLTEAVVNLYKQPNTNSIKDVVALNKARKSTDYKRLDTIAVKLQGGPFSTLYLDIMKYPEYIFTEDTFDYYDFSLSTASTINERPVYVIEFKQKDIIIEPLYYGKLFIDTETLALSSAVYKLNLSNEKMASELFVKRKPSDVEVTPVSANYRVDYRERSGRWFYGYGSVDISFKINKKRKLFNSVYTLSSEMAITDWQFVPNSEIVRPKDRMRPTVVISDEISGFSDPDFWGAYNVIEPEKSIETAIGKIQKQLKRQKG